MDATTPLSVSETKDIYDRLVISMREGALEDLEREYPFECPDHVDSSDGEYTDLPELYYPSDGEYTNHPETIGDLLDQLVLTCDGTERSFSTKRSRARGSHQHLICDGTETSFLCDYYPETLRFTETLSSLSDSSDGECPALVDSDVSSGDSSDVD